MDERQIIQLITNAIYVTLVVSSPIIVVSLVVGIFVSILQTAFSIQEQTLSFVPKILAISLSTLVLGNWMLMFIVDYCKDVFINMGKLVIK